MSDEQLDPYGPQAISRAGLESLSLTKLEFLQKEASRKRDLAEAELATTTSDERRAELRHFLEKVTEGDALLVELIERRRREPLEDQP